MVLHHPVGLEHVGPDLIAPGVVSQALLLRFLAGLPFAHRAVVKTRPQDLHGALPVPVLGPLVLAGDHDPGRQVGDADGGVGDVHVLAALAAGPEGVDAKIALLDLDLDPVVEVRKGGHRGEGRVAAVLGIERGHPDEAVDSRLDAQAAVRMVALDLERGALDPRFLRGLAVQKLDLEPPAPGPADVHFEEHLGPVLGVGPAGAGVDRDDRVLGIVFAGEQPPEFELVELRLETVEVLAEVFRDVFTLADPLGQRLDLVHRPLEAGAPLQLRKHARPAPGQRLAVPRSRPHRRIAQAFVELGDLLAQAIPVKGTPERQRRDRTTPGNGRAVPDS